MRYAAVALVLSLLGISSSSARPAQAGTITLAATVVDVRESSDMRSDLVLLWNRNIRSRPLGHGVLTCTKVGTGGLLGGGISNCSAVYSLPLGKIAAQGILHGYGRYTLVITGGTGHYKGITGTLFVRRIADGVRRLTFIL